MTQSIPKTREVIEYSVVAIQQKKNKRVKSEVGTKIIQLTLFVAASLSASKRKMLQLVS